MRECALKNDTEPPYLEISEDNSSLRIVFWNGKKSEEAKTQMDALRILHESYEAKMVHVSEIESLYFQIIDSSLNNDGMKEVIDEINTLAKGDAEPPIARKDIRPGNLN